MTFGAVEVLGYEHMDGISALNFANEILSLIAALRSERAGREKAETLLIELLGIEAMDAITWMKKARALAGEGDTDE